MKKKKELRRYERPKIKKQSAMVFPLLILQGKRGRLACRQCSSCHGCR